MFLVKVQPGFIKNHRRNSSIRFLLKVGENTLSKNFCRWMSHILFICGGAFERYRNKIIAQRGNTSSRFGADVELKEEKKGGRAFERLEPKTYKIWINSQNFIGRLPVV